MNIRRTLFLLALLAGVATATADEHGAQVKTVLGPRNPALADGAQALLQGDIERGIRLTQRGLDLAQGQRERQAGLSNLCAGYVLLEKYERALVYCDEALAENPRNWRALSNRALIMISLERYDEARTALERAEAVAPQARAIKEVRGLYLDATDPVAPNIVIDDRRDPERRDEG